MPELEDWTKQKKNILIKEKIMTIEKMLLSLQVAAQKDLKTVQYSRKAKK